VAERVMNARGASNKRFQRTAEAVR
jgi:hypothetical protein